MRPWVAALSIAAALAGIDAMQSLRGQTDPQHAPAIYSAAQARGGQSIYVEKCSECHAESLSGAHGPALIGDQFWAEWNQQAARRLYGKIRTSMPLNDPGSLTEKETLAIMAFIFQVNGFPAGVIPIGSADALSNLTLQRPPATQRTP